MFLRRLRDGPRRSAKVQHLLRIEAPSSSSRNSTFPRQPERNHDAQYRCFRSRRRTGTGYGLRPSDAVFVDGRRWPLGDRQSRLRLRTRHDAWAIRPLPADVHLSSGLASRSVWLPLLPQSLVIGFCRRRGAAVRLASPRGNGSNVISRGAVTPRPRPRPGHRRGSAPSSARLREAPAPCARRSPRLDRVRLSRRRSNAPRGGRSRGR